MAIYKSDIVDINLESGSIHRSYLNHTIGSGDNSANRFGVRTFRNGLSEDLSGASCQAIFMNAAGTNIALTSYGTVSGNEAYVTLPQACYNVEGQFTLAIKLVKSGETVTTRIVDGVVCNTGTTGAVAPTSSVPTYQEILSTYDAMVAATAAANGAIAATYSSSSTYAVGDYCIHDGGLYRCTTAITTGEAWTAGHWTAAKIGTDLTATKSALDISTSVNLWDESWDNGTIDASGNNVSGGRVRTAGYIEVEPNTTYYITGGTTLTANFYDASKNNLPDERKQISETFTTGQNVHYMRFFTSSAYDSTNNPQVYKNNISLNYPAGITGYYKHGELTGRAYIFNEFQTIKSDMLKSKVYVTPEMYGAVGDGVTDDTTAIQNALDSGYNVVFKSNQYKTGMLSLTNGDIDIDFGNADIICTDDTLIKCVNPFEVEHYSGAYTANTTYIRGMTNHFGPVLIDSSENIMPGRQDYLAGAVVKCQWNVLETSLPYDISDCSILAQSKIIRNIKIRNISSVATPGGSTTDPVIWLQGVCDSEIINVNFYCTQYEGILLKQCTNCNIKNCNISMYVDFQAYNIAIMDGCSYISVIGCKLFSAYWHCITTGGEHTNINTSVIDTVMSLTRQTGTLFAYSDHGNTIGTSLVRCTITQSVNISDGIIERCKFVNSNFTTQKIHITCQGWLGSNYHSKFKIMNCDTDAEGIQIWLSYDLNNPSSNNMQWIIDDIMIENIICEYMRVTFTSNNVPESITSICINGLTMDSVKTVDYDIGNFVKNAFITNSTIKNLLGIFPNHEPLFIENACLHLSNSDITGDVYDTYSISELFVENCRFTKNVEKTNFNVSDLCMIVNTYLYSNFDLTNLVGSCEYNFSGKSGNIYALYKASGSSAYNTKATPVSDWVVS